MKPVTEEQAQAALAAVMMQFRAYLEPLTLEAYIDADGVFHEALDLGPTCPPPTLMRDYHDAPWAIVWEQGPDDWAHRASVGGTSEEERVLFAQAAQELGVAYAGPPDEDPVAMPAGVEAEPIYSFALGLYPGAGA